MPIYEWKCDCGEMVEQFYHMNDTRPSIRECPKCGGIAKRFFGNLAERLPTDVVIDDIDMLEIVRGNKSVDPRDSYRCTDRSELRQLQKLTNKVRYA